jgi:hypothetical protein
MGKVFLLVTSKMDGSVLFIQQLGETPLVKLLTETSMPPKTCSWQSPKPERACFSFFFGCATILIFFVNKIVRANTFERYALSPVLLPSILKSKGILSIVPSIVLMSFLFAG